MRSAKVPPEVLEREFAKRDAEVLAKSARNFVPLAVLGVVVSEILPFFHEGFPSTPLVSSAVVAMLIGLYLLARSEPTRGRMVIATSALLSWLRPMSGLPVRRWGIRFTPCDRPDGNLCIRLWAFDTDRF